MKPRRSVLRFAIACIAWLAAGPTPLVAAVTLTEARSLPAGDSSLDGQDIIVDAARLTVAGSHAFTSLQLRNGAVLSHPAAVSGQAENAIRLTITGDLVIDAKSRLDVTGLGYGEATSPGAGTRGDYAGAGGGHGGRGSRSAGGAPGVGGAPFGSIVAPDSWGGPGANGGDGTWAPGGGMAHLEVGGTVDVSGALRADGAGAWINNQGGGAGGTVFLKATTLRGAGSITANGGGGEYVDGGGGAGGRIALFLANNEFTGALTANGAGGSGVGGAGTIYLKRGAAPGEVRIANGSPGEWTPVVSPVGFDLIVGANAVVYPTEPLRLGNLTVQANAVLTHATGSTGLVVEAAGGITIAEGGRLSVDGRGYPIGDDGGPGQPAAGGWAGAGAGHGGLGATSASGDTGGRHYGSLLQPTQLGSRGGAGSGGPGSAGGGAIRLIAGGQVLVNGRLTAEGLSSPINNSGGGSGGSIWVTAGSWSGSGVVSVNGGAGEYVDGGGGAGGRIAVYAGTSDFGGTITASGNNGSQRAGAGTIYRKLASESEGHLLVSNGGSPGNLTPLTSPERFRLTLDGKSVSYAESPLDLARLEILSDSVLTHLTGQTNLQVRVRGDATVAAGARITADGKGYPILEDRGPGVGQRGDWAGSGGGHGGLGGHSATGAEGGRSYGSMLEPTTLGSQGGESNSGFGVAGGGAVRLVVDGWLTVDGRVTAEGSSSPVNNSGGGSGGSLWINAGSFAGTGVLSVNGGAGEYVDGGGGGGGRIALYFGKSEFAGAVTAYGAGGSERGGAGTIYQRTVGTPRGELTVHNGGGWGNYTPLSSPEAFLLTLAGNAYVHPESPLTVSRLELQTNSVLTHLPGQTNLSVRVLGNATVAAGGAIAVDGRGFRAGDLEVPGAGQSREGFGSGGGHGGLGGDSARGAAGGISYGSVLEPVDRGSQGGEGSGGSGSPGGGAIRLVVDGVLSLDGRLSANGSSSPINNSGGGAGGSIWVTAASVAGTGAISANGGAGEYIDGGSGAGGRIALYGGVNEFTGSVTAYGGTAGSQRGGAGTIYRRLAGTAFGQVLVHNGGAWGNYTPLLAPEPFQLILAEMAQAYSQSAQLVVRDLEIRTNAVLTHLTGQARCDVHVLNNLTLAEGGVITADGRGYPVGDDRGPGAGGESGGFGGGAGHGGRGGRTLNGFPGGAAYGSQVEPLALGSQGGPGNGGAGGAGGGAVRLLVDHAFTLLGRISANGLGTPANNAGGGSGGSVYLSAGSLSGTGLITVNGGAGEYIDGGGGAGGRIALHAQQNEFAGTLLARGGGGSAHGGSGTIYTRLGAEPGGQLVLDNGGNGGALSPLDVPPSTRLVLAAGTTVYPVGPLEVVSLHLKPGATLTHTNGQSGLSIRVAGDLTLDAGATLVANGLGYPVGNDPGPGSGQTGGSAGGGGAHGGNGGLAWPGDVVGGVAYGSVVEPTTFGSSSGAGGGAGNALAPGGGAIRVVVDGAFTLDGVVAADGTSAWYNNQGGGAGGSIWVTTGRLLGSGNVHANGGTGEYIDGGGGGGGRIALHLGTDGFSGTVAAHGGGGHQKGGAGTIYTRLAAESVGRVLVENGDVWGTYTPLVASEPFHLTLANRAQAYAEGTLVVGSLVIGTNTVVTHLPTQDGFSAVVLGDATLAGVIDVNGQGYPRAGDHGPGAGGLRDWAGSGAGHGGLGGTSATGLPGGADYGSAFEPTALGSSGGNGPDGPGGAGGGAVRLIVGQTLTLDGTLSANGLNGRVNNSGGGSGGSVFLSTRTFTGGGAITAHGGAGEYVDGGGGSGGRIAVNRTADTFTGSIAANGAGGSARGENGTIHQGSVAGVVWLSPPADWIAGETPLEVAFFAGRTGTSSVVFTVWRDGVATPLGRATGELTAVTVWNTTAFPDGPCELEAAVFDAQGTPVATARRPVAVQNSVVWHGGPITASETWEPGRVHAVRRDLTVADGRTLTLAPGVVVKFLPGTRLILQNGATLATPATAELPVQLTSFLDDGVGGDSNLDGATTRPQAGSWRLVLGASSIFAPNGETRLRYHSQSYGGTLAADDTWSADSLREITETVVVPSGVTLRIEAGAIVKFAAGRGLDVGGGGTLVVAGTAVQPVVFTSIRDDAFGGDTNADGTRTTPAAGDWRSVRLADGSSATLDHAQLRYGGNSVGNPWGAGGVLEALGGTVTVRHCVLADALKDGAFCYGTTRFENCLVLRCDRGLTAVGTMEVVNCTVDQCRIGLLEHVGQLNVRNTLVSRSIDAGIEHDLGGGRVLATHCNVWNPDARRGNYSGVADPTGQDGNLSAEPLYRDADGDNFRLNFTSPGIDAADGTVAPATDFAGTPRYDDPRTGNTGVPSANGAVPDIGAFEFAETAPSNLDLAVASVNGPAALTAGALVRVEWTILNRGAEAFTGPWHDAIYLKHATTGEKLWVGEALVGRSSTLGPGQTYTAGADLRVPGGVDGDYRWVIEANSRADVFEGANAANNEGTSAAGSRLVVPVIPLDGGLVAGSFAAQEESHWFQVAAPAGRDVRVALDLAGAGVSELYVGRGFMPTPENFTARQREFGSADTTAIASGGLEPGAGTATNTFYILAIGRIVETVPGGFRMAATTPGFDVESVAPGRVGNAGLVTLDLRGSGFTTHTVFSVRRGGDIRREIRRSARESGRIYATFDLTDLPPGAADVVAEDGGLTVTRPAAVDVAAGGTGDFYAELKGPATTRAGRTTTWFVTYGNRGLTDVKLPLVRFSAPGATDVSVYESTLNWAPEFTFWAIHPEALLPTLGPGQEATFEVRVKTFQTTRIGLAVVAGAEFAADPRPFDWSSLPAPAGAKASAWAAMVGGLDARLGATVGQYQALLERDLAELAISPLRFSYLANLNGRWLFGNEPDGVSTERPLNPVPADYREPAAQPGLHGASAAPPPDGIRKTWWVVVSVEDYTTMTANDPEWVWNDLPGTRKDAEDLADYATKDLRTPGDQYVAVHDTPGDNQEVRRQTLLDAIRSLKGKVDADDNVVVVYSGHGATKPDGTPYIALNGDYMSPVALGLAIDEVGAGTTYFVNDSCHSQAFNEGVKTSHTTFVGFAGTQSAKISHDTASGGELIKGLKGQLRKCHSLGLSMDLTEQLVTKKYEKAREERRRQHPVLTNPSEASLEGKPWNDPSGFEQTLRRFFNDGHFQDWTQSILNIVGSVDPNDKYALAGAGPARWVPPSQILPFQIVFENKTNAAAPAQEVLVTDDLDPRLDWSTFELASIAFNDATITVPPGLQRYSTTTTVGTDPYEVAVDASLNPVTGRITWLMRSRDPATGDLPEDPYAGFLPPNDATRRGEGSLTYTVRSRADLADGTQLTNRATIVFDPTYGANPPILTPWVTNTIDAVAPGSAVQPLPAQGVGEIPLSWGGQDAPGGSGIASYDIYTSRNGGPYAPWLMATTNTTARFLGEPGSAYRFYSVARDAAGNTEAAPAEPDASISLGGGAASVGIARDGEQLRVTFEGILESAPTVRGPWTEVPGAVSPHLASPTASERFYRARR